MRRLSTLLFLLIAAAGCSNGVAPESKHPFDSVFPGTWTGTYTLGQLTLRVVPASQIDLATFMGEATFVVAGSGRKEVREFRAIGHADSFIFFLYPPGDAGGLAGGDGHLADKDTLVLEWSDRQPAPYDSLMGGDARVILTR